MKPAPMRFNGYTWHHNPKTIEIVSDKKTVVLSVPYSVDIIKDFGDKPIRIKGQGELYGEDCLQQYSKLTKLYKSCDTGILSLPGLKPFYAHFDTLTMSATSLPSVISYSFSFTCISNNTEKDESPVFVTPKPDDTLWDIAYEYDVPIETLIELNKQVYDTFELDNIERIRIC